MKKVRTLDATGSKLKSPFGSFGRKEGGISKVEKLKNKAKKWKESTTDVLFPVLSSILFIIHLRKWRELKNPNYPTGWRWPDGSVEVRPSPPPSLIFKKFNLIRRSTRNLIHFKLLFFGLMIYLIRELNYFNPITPKWQVSWIELINWVQNWHPYI